MFRRLKESVRLLKTGEYGVNGMLLNAIKSMYVNRGAAVRIDGDLSDSFSVWSGLRHRCTICPLLFIVYMDKIIRAANLIGK